MSRAAAWILALLVGLAAVAGLVALIQSRDDSALEEPAAVTEPPGEPRTTDLPPALERDLARGNVVLLHRSRTPPPEYADTDAGLRAAGQAVIARRDAGLETAFAALSEDRELTANGLPGLSEFIDYWLGGR